MKSPLLVLLMAFSAAPALQADETTPLPSYVQDAGWPQDANGVVQDLKSTRLTGSLETEQLILINDVLFLAFRPGRYSEFVELARGVNSMQVIPNGDGTHSLILVKSEGAVLIGWDWDTPDYITTQSLPADFVNWGDVQAMWVQEVSGTQKLYGYDGGAGVIRRAQHCSGVWTMDESLASHGALRDLAFVELDPTSPGEEIVLLEKYDMIVMSADGEQILDKTQSKATDSIAVLRSPSVASADLLVHSYMDSGSHYVRVRNSTQSSPGFLLGSTDCTAILPRKSTQFGDHLLLTRGGSGDVDVLEIHSSTGPGGLVLSRNGAGAWVDTHEDEDQRPVQAATLVDFDLDGQEDLMVAVRNGN
ncbi:MAG: hypothetical protein GY930_14045, partial [bacterium]|nr:hypothetical protein [bacterium]